MQSRRTRAEKVRPYDMRGGSATELVYTLESFLADQPMFGDVGTQSLWFDDVDLEACAVRGFYSQQETALHLLLSQLADYELYQYGYDDDDFKEDVGAFQRFVDTKFRDMGILTPKVFLDGTYDQIFRARKTHAAAFKKGLDTLVDQAFAQIWTTRYLLEAVGNRLRPIVRSLKQAKYNNLAFDGRISRCSIPTWVVQLVRHRDRERCFHCGNVVSSALVEVQSFHIDHMIPLADGGTNDPTNFVLACPDCNRRKGMNLWPSIPKFYWPNFRNVQSF